jgi:hypothetical protein
MPDVVEDFCEVRHYIGRIAACGDDIVDAGLLRNVLAHEIDHVIEGLDTVQRRTCSIGCTCRVGRDAVEAEFGGAIGQRRLCGRGILVAGVPVQDDIDIVEYAIAHHVHLAAAALLRGCADEPHRARCAGLFQPVFHRDCGACRAGAEQVVSTGMARMLVVDRQPRRYGILVDTGQCIELRQDGNHRAAIAVPGDKCRRHSGHAGLDRKTLGIQFLLEQCRAPCLLVADFGVFPDRTRDLGGVFVAPVDEVEYRFFRLCGGVPGRQDQQRDDRADRNYPHDDSPSFPT